MLMERLLINKSSPKWKGLLLNTITSLEKFHPYLLNQRQLYQNQIFKLLKIKKQYLALPSNGKMLVTLYNNVSLSLWVQLMKNSA
jgi:hypothetical protein